MNAQALAETREWLASPRLRQLVESGQVVRTRILDAGERASIAGPLEALGGEPPAGVLEHERIPFPSFPYEWPPEMLHRAAALTLDLTAQLLDDGIGLKDGTPYNILFRGPEPVFVDMLSFERRDPEDPTWLAYAQFVRTFLLPLLAYRALGLSPDQTLATRRDGIEPEELYRWLKPWQRLARPALTLVSLAKWLSPGKVREPADIYRPRRTGNPEKARFILRSLYRGLGRALRRLEPRPAQTIWSDYMTTQTHYDPAQLAAKEAFVQAVIEEFRPSRVLDVGSNTGHFSLLAARGGARVVAIDSDPAVAGSLWRGAYADKLDVLPLVVSLTRPTPAMGWRNSECPGFLERARGGFDAVFMLAVIHHMLVSDRVPLDEILDLAAELTTSLLVIEYVAPSDPMFQRLVRGREKLHAQLTLDVFENACRRSFEVVRHQRVEGSDRTLYLLRKR